MVERIAELLKLNEEKVKERLRYLDLGEEEIKLLHELAGNIGEEDAERIFTSFYEHLLKFEDVRKIFLREEGLIEALKRKQIQHLTELLTGNYDLDYALKRLNVGLVHEREGVDVVSYTGAFAKWTELVVNLLKDRVHKDKLIPTVVALFKAVIFDLTLSIDAYYYTRILKSTEKKYQTILDAVNDGVVIVELETKRIVDINKKMEQLIGVEESKVVGREVYWLYPEELEDTMKHRCRLYIEKGEGVSGLFHIENKESGEWIPVELSLGRYEFDGKRYVVVVFRDIRERLRHEEEVRRLNKLYEALSSVNMLTTTSGSVDFIFRGVVEALEKRGGFKYAGMFASNGKVESLHESGEFTDADVSVCVPIDTIGGRLHFLVVSRYGEEPFSREEIELLREIAHDVSFGVRRVSSEERLTHLALHDQLTDLPNRAYFVQRLNEFLNTARNTGREVGLLLIDIDHFRELNEALGHTLGDKVLKEVAEKLRDVVRSSDFLARVGGDEFGIIVNSDNANGAIEKLIGRILTRFDKPLDIDGRRIYITFSFGASVFPQDVESSEVLFSNAMASVERAKGLGGNRLVMYSGGVSKATEEKVRLRVSLRGALENEEFKLYYQPKVDLKTGRVVGAEALLRWVRTGEVVPPGKFIPVLEEGELIHRVGEWVIKEAIRQSEEWRKMGISVPVAVNVSPIQLKVPTFAEHLISSLEKCDCERCNLEIEITESAVMEDVALSVELIKTLRDMGIRTYIDDFGTGHSSLAYLKKLPVQGLKIDREFIKDLPGDREDLEIVKAALLLAKTFGFETVAEGIETEEQRNILRELGCDTAQGYFFAKPMPVEDFERYVLENLSGD
ncbi:EAL domain-containing protein [Hydrogenivirga sp.]